MNVAYTSLQLMQLLKHLCEKAASFLGVAAFQRDIEIYVARVCGCVGK